jgi:MFS family permease
MNDKALIWQLPLLRKLLLIYLLQMFASGILIFVMPWLVLLKTGSAASTVLVFLALSLPQLVTFLPAGALLDRYGKRF